MPLSCPFPLHCVIHCSMEKDKDIDSPLFQLFLKLKFPNYLTSSYRTFMLLFLYTVFNVLGLFLRWGRREREDQIHKEYSRKSYHQVFIEEQHFLALFFYAFMYLNIALLCYQILSGWSEEATICDTFYFSFKSIYISQNQWCQSINILTSCFGTAHP